MENCSNCAYCERTIDGGRCSNPNSDKAWEYVAETESCDEHRDTVTIWIR